MVQSYKSGRAFRFGPGLGLSLSKYFGPISGLHTKLFDNIKSNDVFLSRRGFVVLIAVTYVSEVIVIFHQLILFANQRWSDSGFLLSYPVFEKWYPYPIRLLFKLKSYYPYTKTIRKCIVMHNIYFCAVYFASWGKITAGIILLVAEHDWLK